MKKNSENSNIKFDEWKRLRKSEQEKVVDSDKATVNAEFSDDSSSSTTTSSSDHTVPLPVNMDSSNTTSSYSSSPKSFDALVVYKSTSILPKLDALVNNDYHKKYLQRTPNTVESIPLNEESDEKKFNFTEVKVSFIKSFSGTIPTFLTSKHTSSKYFTTGSMLNTDSSSSEWSDSYSMTTPPHQLSEDEILALNLYVFTVQPMYQNDVPLEFCKQFIPSLPDSVRSLLIEMHGQQVDSATDSSITLTSDALNFPDKKPNKPKPQYNLQVENSDTIYLRKSKSDRVSYDSLTKKYIEKYNVTYTHQIFYDHKANIEPSCTYGYIYNSNCDIELVYKIIAFDISIELIRDVLIPKSLIRVVQNRFIKTHSKSLRKLKLIYFNHLMVENRRLSLCDFRTDEHNRLRKRYQFLLLRSTTRIFNIIIDDYYPCII